MTLLVNIERAQSRPPLRWLDRARRRGGASLSPAEEGRYADLALGWKKRDYSRHWTPVHLDFVVGNMNAAVATHPYGLLALLADPFGNGFCLIELRGRGYDEIAL